MNDYLNQPSIAILLASFNGSRYIEEQLDSIYKQNYSCWKLFVSDDGSTDDTLLILKRYQSAWGISKLEILEGPAKGFQSNFMSLITNNNIDADYYALCDQDDVWLPSKLINSINLLQKQNTKKPVLYCSRTQYVDVNLKGIGYSNIIKKSPSLGNALMQCLAGGNTMVFNNSLKKINIKFSSAPIVSHDWWLYLTCELFDGHTIYDEKPSILYRQHPQSLVGSNTSFGAKLNRLMKMLSGIYNEWNTIHYNAIKPYINDAGISNKNRMIIKEFERRRKSKNLITRISIIYNLGCYRQSYEGNIALYVGLLLNKF